MIEMLILLNGCITEFTYEITYEELLIRFKNDSFRVLSDGSSSEIYYFLKDYKGLCSDIKTKIKYI